MSALKLRADTLRAAFFDYRDCVGRASTGGAILYGEREALLGAPGGGGATVAGSDELVRELEKRYGLALTRTREKRARAAEAGQHGDREAAWERRALGLD